ncbi:MAG TPA: hypothetical protein VKV29_02520 [Chthonomonas sp.]|uniref:hypothetical protein n=1 Tax=Chthonomonas sp. TaxID=2282153 RepID=UPI002B4AD695|nr:hypothetical protein [Chthonomonas sp.]HLH79140.1 hypothetical protein [Chthonomonas sp.]
MSLSNRLYRIARSKLNELKEWFDRVEEERTSDPLRSPEELAAEELDSALHSSAPVSPASSSSSARPPQKAASPAPETDPLYYHYRLLGLQPGADLTAVQAAYKRYAERANPARFPPGSPEEAVARDLRRKLDLSYKTLCEALDPTLRRFELLEFDTFSAPQKEENS